jgi:hypothetical protein
VVAVSFFVDEKEADKPYKYNIPKDSSIAIHRPGVNHKFFFHKEKEGDADNSSTGIFIIKNNMNLPNKINLFDWTDKDNINREVNPSIERLSSMLVDEMYDDNAKSKKELGTPFGERPDNVYLARLKFMTLSSILYVFNEWIKLYGNGIKLNLRIIDSSCRSLCGHTTMIEREHNKYKEFVRTVINSDPESEIYGRTYENYMSTNKPPLPRSSSFVQSIALPEIKLENKADKLISGL